MIIKVDDMYNSRDYAFYKKGKHIGVFRINNFYDQTRQIWDLSIKEEYRGQGFGQQMLKELLTKFAKNRKIALGCKKNNTIALHIYQKFGFTIVKDCNTYYWLER